MVGISLLTLVPGVMGGSETYAREFCRALADHGELDYRVYVPPIAPDAGGGLPAELVDEYRPARGLGERALAMGMAALRPGPIRRRFSAARAIHFPLTVAVPEPRAPFAVTLEDVLHHDLPELVPRVETFYRRFAYDRSAWRAQLVIVPSAFVRDQASERLGIPPERFRVIHHGLNHERFRPGSEAREPFLLYPAWPWPHKNHARLFEAFALLRREQPELRLVLTGGGRAGPSLPDGVDVRGLVSADELVSLYRRAAALVFPSRYEGFGAPPLEAMACGCPVACSHAASLPEVVGEAARSFDPDDPEAIAAAVLDVLANPEPWIVKGLERAWSFTWEHSAREHEAVYRELIAVA